jgi:hypothetical protein
MTTLNQLTAIDAAHAASTTSDKYGFVSSRAIIDNLQNLGFTPRKIEIQRANKIERQGFQKHIVRMRHSQLMPTLGEEFPEIILINSHDGLSSLKMMLGIFKLVCSNGMVSGSVEDEIKYTHRKVNLDAINEGAMNLVGRAGRINDSVNRMKSRQLTITERNDFIHQAALLRYDEPNQIQLDSLNRLRRYDDRGDNLWNTFNRVQENLTQGRRYSGIRRITSPSADVAINRGLWNLAESILN